MPFFVILNLEQGEEIPFRPFTAKKTVDFTWKGIKRKTFFAMKHFLVSS